MALSQLPCISVNVNIPKKKKALTEINSNCN